MDLMQLNFTFTNNTYEEWALGVARPAIIDSGTSFLFMPMNDTKALLQELSARLNLTFYLKGIPYVLDCNEGAYNQFPDLQFMMN